MWLSIVSAWACEPELELSTWIPEEGALPVGAYIRAEHTAEDPVAELHGPEEALFELEERGDPPEGWTAWVLPDEVEGEGWELQVYEGEELLDTLAIQVDPEAEGGALPEDFELSAVVSTELTEEPPYLLCDTAYEGEWVLVTLELELPESPGPGWTLEFSEKAQPQTWAAWPTYGGTTTGQFIVHWTLQESCPRVTVYDAFGQEQDNLRVDCTVLPKPASDGGEGYTQNRWDEVCGCASSSPRSWAFGLALLALGGLLARPR